MKKHPTDKTAELITTDLNFLKICIDVRAGKMIRLEISIAPIMRMPSTIVIAVKNAMIMLYDCTFVPVAFAKVSSNVIAKYGYKR